MQETKRLLEIMARLRDPDEGCPWDVEQDFASIAPYTLEEAYEVADAIEREDMAALKEELGDLLLQVVFHSQMAQEAGLFDFEEVAAGINAKMVRRHPHVFGVSGRQSPVASDQRPETSDSQIQRWEAIKQQEKAEKGHDSVLDDVPLAFPALLRAQKLGKKASKRGFDWPQLAPVFDKVQEEIAELQEALQPSSSCDSRSEGAGSPTASGDSVQSLRDSQNDAVEEELGDLLFAVVNVARHVKVDAETALRKANAKFEARFRAIEPQITEDSTLEEMEALWQKAKAGY